MSPRRLRDGFVGGRPKSATSIQRRRGRRTSLWPAWQASGVTVLRVARIAGVVWTPGRGHHSILLRRYPARNAGSWSLALGPEVSGNTREAPPAPHARRPGAARREGGLLLSSGRSARTRLNLIDRKHGRRQGGPPQEQRLIPAAASTVAASALVHIWCTSGAHNSGKLGVLVDNHG